jgi:hypothetical protein
MFGESLFESVARKKPPKMANLPISLLGHALLFGSFIIIPLMNADQQMPEIKVTNVFMSAPPRPASAASACGQKRQREKV